MQPTGCSVTPGCKACHGGTGTPVPATAKTDREGIGREEKWFFGVGVYADKASVAISRTVSPKSPPENSNQQNWSKVHGPDQVTTRQISEAGTLFWPRRSPPATLNVG